MDGTQQRAHSLERKYGLTAYELLDAIERRFRLRVALEGAVAEVHFERKLRVASREGWLHSYEGHDVDGMHDFTIVTPCKKLVRVEVKTIRNGPGWKVEVQKTRAAKSDPSSRYYAHGQFDILAVCVGRATNNWEEFRYVLMRDLPRHPDYPDKVRVMHPIPAGDQATQPRWFSRFQDALDAFA